MFSIRACMLGPGQTKLRYLDIKFVTNPDVFFGLRVDKYMIVMQVDLTIFILLGTIILLTEYQKFSSTPPDGTGRQQAAGWEKGSTAIIRRNILEPSRTHIKISWYKKCHVFLLMPLSWKGRKQKRIEFRWFTVNIYITRSMVLFEGFPEVVFKGKVVLLGSKATPRAAYSVRE